MLTLLLQNIIHRWTEWRNQPQDLYVELRRVNPLP